MQNKINLNNKTKIGKLTFDLRQFSIPYNAIVDFSTAQVKYETEEVNGERQNTDVIQYTTLDLRDAVAYDALENAGADTSAVATVKCQVLSGFDEILQRIEKSESARISLVNPKVQLVWDNAHKHWHVNDLKLVAESIAYDKKK
jgi:hypothetical protein